MAQDVKDSLLGPALHEIKVEVEEVDIKPDIVKYDSEEPDPTPSEDQNIPVMIKTEPDVSWIKIEVDALPDDEGGPSGFGNDPLKTECPDSTGHLKVEKKDDESTMEFSPDLHFEMEEDELYGILTESNDRILDEWTNKTPDVENVDDTLQDANAHIQEQGDNSQEENTTAAEELRDWCPGNPDCMVELPFSETAGILPPHQMAEKTPLDFFFLFLNGEIIDLIISCTNKTGNRLKAAASATHSRFKRWTDITMNELKIFLGILLLMGTIKLNRMADYWSNNYLFRLIPQQFMSRDKFYLILRALNVQRNERNESLYKIKDLIDLFNNTINSIYYPVKELTIDESLILWKGRLAFRQYLKGKAHKYGVKLYILADANGIILKIHVYAGSQDQLVGGRNHVKKVIMLLMQKYFDKGHSLYLDNFYTSVGIADQLLGKNTYVTGTLRPNRVGNPEIVKNTQLSMGESCIAHNDKKIIVTKWKDKREVWFLSTEHKSNYEGTTSRRIRTVKFKPAVQVRYNKFMRAIDKHDQLLSYYSCEHKSLRWYKKVIIHIIQICLVNGYLLYNKNNPIISLYDFRKNIIEALLPMPSFTELARPLSEGKTHLPANLPKREGKSKRKRCRVCYQKSKKRVAVVFGCPDCPGFPGLCLQCFREFHKY